MKDYVASGEGNKIGSAGGSFEDDARGAGDDEDKNELIKAQQLEALRKEEDEYAKMEALFIGELELKPDELPSFAKGIVPIAKVSK